MMTQWLSLSGMPACGGVNELAQPLIENPNADCIIDGGLNDDYVVRCPILVISLKAPLLAHLYGFE
jgi:hypothetical protein